MRTNAPIGRPSGEVTRASAVELDVSLPGTVKFAQDRSAVGHGVVNGLLSCAVHGFRIGPGRQQCITFRVEKDCVHVRLGGLFHDQPFAQDFLKPRVVPLLKPFLHGLSEQGELQIATGQ